MSLDKVISQSHEIIYEFRQRLDKIMTPIVKSLSEMDITSLYTVIPNNEGLQALKYFSNQRPIA